MEEFTLQQLLEQMPSVLAIAEKRFKNNNDYYLLLRDRPNYDSEKLTKVYERLRFDEYQLKLFSQLYHNIIEHKYNLLLNQIESTIKLHEKTNNRILTKWDGVISFDQKTISFYLNPQ